MITFKSIVITSAVALAFPAASSAETLTMLSDGSDGGPVVCQLNMDSGDTLKLYGDECKDDQVSSKSDDDCGAECEAETDDETRGSGTLNPYTDFPILAASSFRGVQLGMPREQIKLLSPKDMTASDKPFIPSGDVGMDKASQGMFDTVAKILGKGIDGASIYKASLFFLNKEGKICGWVVFSDEATPKASKLTFSPCYFGVEGNIDMKDFGQQVVDKYNIPSTEYSYEKTLLGGKPVNVERYRGVSDTFKERFTITRVFSRYEDTLCLTVESEESKTINFGN